MYETFIILGTATAADIFWVKVVNPWLDKRPIEEVFIRPKEKAFSAPIKQEGPKYVAHK